MSLITVTSKFQATIPQDVRRYLGVKAGDKLAFAIEEGQVVLRRMEDMDRHYLTSVETQLTEWLSDEDDVAFSHL